MHNIAELSGTPDLGEMMNIGLVNNEHSNMWDCGVCEKYVIKSSSFQPTKGAESRLKGEIPLERFVRAACGATKRRVEHNSAFAPPCFFAVALLYPENMLPLQIPMHKRRRRRREQFNSAENFLHLSIYSNITEKNLY